MISLTWEIVGWGTRLWECEMGWSCEGLQTATEHLVWRRPADYGLRLLPGLLHQEIPSRPPGWNLEAVFAPAKSKPWFLWKAVVTGINMAINFDVHRGSPSEGIPQIRGIPVSPLSWIEMQDVATLDLLLSGEDVALSLLCASEPIPACTEENPQCSNPNMEPSTNAVLF